MDASCKAKILNARTIQEALKVVETNKITLGASAEQLLRTAFAIQETQPTYAQTFKETVVKEVGSAIDTEKVHDSGIDKIKEGDSVTSGSGNAGSEQSSSIDGLKDEGKDAPNSDIESMQTASGENQMGKISENIGCPQGMDPSVYQQMGQQGQVPQMPQMTPPQQMQQMRYTAETIVAPIVKENAILKETVRKLVEAVRTIDGKIQEATAFGGKGMSLEIPSGTFNKTPRAHISETIPSAAGMISFPELKHPRGQTADARESIREMNKQLQKS